MNPRAQTLPPLLVALVAILTACSAEPADDREAAAPPQTAASADAGRAPERAYEYTRLSDCRTVREETEEGQFLEQECPGAGRYRLRRTVGDLRANIHVIGLNGDETSLDLSRIGGGGFSAVGETLEWRGPAGDPLAPDSLIVRYNVVEDPESNVEVSYLLPVRLSPTPCVIGKVAPGSGQNVRARDLADAGGACLVD